MLQRTCARSFGPEITDAVLVKEHQAGDLDAFAELYRRHHNVVRGYIRKRMNVSDDIDDLVQDAFTLALENIDRFWDFADEYDDRSFPRWLCGFAGRALRIEGHRAYRARRAFADSIRLFTLDLDHGPVEHRDPPEITDEILAAVKRLRPHYRQAIELHYIDGLSISETAKRMGYKPHSVAYFLRNAASEIANPGKVKRTNRPARHDGKAAREKLLAAAREVIAEVGVDRATAAEITRRAGFAHQSIINTHFGGKAALLALAA